MNIKVDDKAARLTKENPSFSFEAGKEITLIKAAIGGGESFASHPSLTLVISDDNKNEIKRQSLLSLVPAIQPHPNVAELGATLNTGNGITVSIETEEKDFEFLVELVWKYNQIQE